jgi:hypothetical protein
VSFRQQNAIRADKVLSSVETFCDVAQPTLEVLGKAQFAEAKLLKGVCEGTKAIKMLNDVDTVAKSEQAMKMCTVVVDKMASEAGGYIAGKACQGALVGSSGPVGAYVATRVCGAAEWVGSKGTEFLVEKTSASKDICGKLLSPSNAPSVPDALKKIPESSPAINSAPLFMH